MKEIGWTPPCRPAFVPDALLEDGRPPGTVLRLDGPGVRSELDRAHTQRDRIDPLIRHTTARPELEAPLSARAALLARATTFVAGISIVVAAVIDSVRSGQAPLCCDRCA